MTDVARTPADALIPVITPVPASPDRQSAGDRQPATTVYFTSRRLVLVALGILICRLLIALTIIPAWQHPDEHIHVAVAEIWRNQIVDADTSDPGREEEILRSMGEHNWWQHYGKSIPDGPLPAKFALAPEASTIGITPTSAGYPPAYYGFIGAALSTMPRMPVVSDVYAMRTVSIVLGVLTLLAAWSGVRVALGEHGAAIVTLLLALHPQFAVVSTSAGPDALVNLAGACVWWQAMLALNRANWVLPLGGVWTAAVVGAMADRMGVPLLVAAFLVSLTVVLRRIGIRPMTVALTLGAGAAVAAALWLMDASWNSFLAERVGYQLTVVPQAATSNFLLSFMMVFARSWWFTLGWVRYAPPSWWVALVFALSAAAAVGVMRRLSVEQDGRVRAVAGLAMMMIATQLAAVLWTYYRIAHGAQGRHLFPFLIPALMLLWIGVEALTPMQYRRRAAIGLVLTFALLDSAAWILVGIPAYAA